MTADMYNHTVAPFPYMAEKAEFERLFANSKKDLRGNMQVIVNFATNEHKMHIWEYSNKSTQFAFDAYMCATLPLANERNALKATNAELVNALKDAIIVAERLDDHMNSVQQASMECPSYEKAMDMISEAEEALKQYEAK